MILYQLYYTLTQYGIVSSVRTRIHEYEDDPYATETVRASTPQRRALLYIFINLHLRPAPNGLGPGDFAKPGSQFCASSTFLIMEKENASLLYLPRVFFVGIGDVTNVVMI